MNLNQKLIISLSFGCIILSTFVDSNDKSNLNPSKTSVQKVVPLNGGAQNRSSENTAPPQALKQNVNKREIPRKHFPDWEERKNYQKKQEKIYKSAMRKKREIQRLRMLETHNLYTKEEVDAISYFQGTGFYRYYQSLETPPNIFDTRWSFLLKVEKNKNMRDNFLKSYNRRESEN